MDKQRLRFERQELINYILELENYQKTVTDEVEMKHIAYQLQAMRNYRAALEARIHHHHHTGA